MFVCACAGISFALSHNELVCVFVCVCVYMQGKYKTGARYFHATGEVTQFVPVTSKPPSFIIPKRPMKTGRRRASHPWSPEWQEMAASCLKLHCNWLGYTKNKKVENHLNPPIIIVFNSVML